jgi:hypothetical protein
MFIWSSILIEICMEDYVGRIKAMKTIDDWHKAGRLKGCEYKQISISPLPLKMENLFSEILKIENPSNPHMCVLCHVCVHTGGLVCPCREREREREERRGEERRGEEGDIQQKRSQGRWTQIISRLARQLACVSLPPCHIMSSFVSRHYYHHLSLALSYPL